jgi:D-alanyl-D-alanine carboxypeptidase
VVSELRHSRRAALLCLLAYFACAPARSAVDAAAVDGIVLEWLAGTAAPSVSIAIVLDGRLAYAKAYGAARVNPTVRSTPSTRSAIDSVS